MLTLKLLQFKPFCIDQMEFTSLLQCL